MKTALRGGIVLLAALLAFGGRAWAKEGYAAFMGGSRYEGGVDRCDGSGKATFWSPLRQRYESYKLDDVYKIVLLYKSYQKLDVCPESHEGECPDYWMWSNKEPGRIVVVKKNAKGGPGEKNYYEFIKGDGCFQVKTVAPTKNLGDHVLFVRFFMNEAAYIKDQEHFDWIKDKLVHEVYFVPPPKPPSPEPLKEGDFKPEPPAPAPIPLPSGFGGGFVMDEANEAPGGAGKNPSSKSNSNGKQMPDFPIDIEEEMEGVPTGQ